MKRLLLMVLLALNLKADFIERNEEIPEFHQVIKTVSKKIELTGKEEKEFIYLGRLNDYTNVYTQINGNLANGAVKGLEVAGNSVANTMGTGLQNGLQGAGIGLIFGVGVAIYDKSNEDFKYVYVYDLTNSKNEKTRITVLFITDKFDNEEVIKNYITKF